MERKNENVTIPILSPNLVFGTKAGGEALAKFIKESQACIKPWRREPPLEDHSWSQRAAAQAPSTPELHTIHINFHIKDMIPYTKYLDCSHVAVEHVFVAVNILCYINADSKKKKNACWLDKLRNPQPKPKWLVDQLLKREDTSNATLCNPTTIRKNQNCEIRLK